MAEDFHEKLADMIENEDFAGMKKTPSLLRLIRLQYTSEEASLALVVTFEGKKINEISARTGIETDQLKQRLETMAHKGTVWLDPGEEDPTYRAVGMVAPGLLETGLLGNLRFPYSVELGKAIHPVIHEWVEQSLSRMPPGTLPMWPATAALPEDADPSDNLLERVKEYDDWCLATCPCKLSHWLDTPGDHCQHFVQTCMPRGKLGQYLAEYGMARRITTEEAVDMLQKFEANGLVHTGDPKHGLCNCCHDCCPYFISWHQHGVQVLQRSNYLPEIDSEECIACSVCADRCPVGAIEVEDMAVVKGDICIGCGVCVVGCTTEAMRFVKRPEDELLSRSTW
jgi:electron transport complex protein RnfB